MRSGPIVQASLNISTMNLITQLCSAENWCQRIGRANRFGSEESIAKVTTVMDEKIFDSSINLNNSELKFLNLISDKNKTIAWVHYFKNKNFQDDNLNCTTTLSEIYKQYIDFHSLPSTKEAYQEDFSKIIDESFKIFQKNDFTPMQYWKKPKKTKNKKLSSLSIRGSSVYVLPAYYDIFTKEIGDWVYVPNPEVDMSLVLSLNEDDLKHHSYIFNNQAVILQNTRIDSFSEATYSSQKQYKKMNNTKIIMEAKTITSPLLISYSQKEIFNAKISKEGIYYLKKGSLKIGLYELSGAEFV